MLFLFLFLCRVTVCRLRFFRSEILDVVNITVVNINNCTYFFPSLLVCYSILSYLRFTGSLLIITIFLLLYVFSYVKRMLLHTVHIQFWVSLRALLKIKCFIYIYIFYYSLDLFGLIINGTYTEIYPFCTKKDELMRRHYKSRKKLHSKWKCSNVSKWYLLIYYIWPLDGDRETLM